MPPVRALVDVGRRSIERFYEMDGIDRSMGLAAQGFTALFPILIILAATLESGEGASLGDSLVERLDLTGTAAAAAERAFPPSGDVEQGITGLSVLILLITALSFARALQRMYEKAWRLEARGMRDTPWGLLWLAGLCAYASLHPVLHGELSHWLGIAASIAGSFVVFLATPYVVLARRLPWRRLVGQAVLAAIGMTAFRAGSGVYLPHAVGSAAEQFGTIGLAFTLVSWLFGAAIVLTATAALGASLAEREIIRSR
jgi:membrane protein